MNHETPIAKPSAVPQRIAIFFDRLNQREHGYNAINTCLKCFVLIFMMYFVVTPKTKKKKKT